MLNGDQFQSVGTGRPTTPYHPVEYSDMGAPLERQGSAVPPLLNVRSVAGVAAVGSTPSPGTVGFTEFSQSLIRGYFAEAPMMHAIPTLYVIGASCFAVSLLTIFLQTTVVNATGHLSVFFFGAFTCFSSYYMAAHFLGENARSFQRISPDKKLYTVSNLIKAGVLAALTPMGFTALRDGMIYDEWNANTLRNLGCIYAIPDFVSLIVVRRMSTSTIVHHVCVLVCCFFNMYNDFAKPNIFRLLAVYGAFSTFGYVTYMLLATRFLGVSPGLARAISLISLIVFFTCCCVNWVWQTTYLAYLYHEHHHWSIYPYMAIISLVVYDDVNLCKWLLHHTRFHHKANAPAPGFSTPRAPVAETTAADSAVRSMAGSPHESHVMR